MTCFNQSLPEKKLVYLKNIFRKHYRDSINTEQISTKQLSLSCA